MKTTHYLPPEYTVLSSRRTSASDIKQHAKSAWVRAGALWTKKTRPVEDTLHRVKTNLRVMRVRPNKPQASHWALCKQCGAKK